MVSDKEKKMSNTDGLTTIKKKESHKEIKKADKQITKIRDQTLATHEAMYNYELQAIEIQVNHEKEIIKGDLEVKNDTIIFFLKKKMTHSRGLYITQRNIGLARKVITSENGKYLQI